MRLLWVKGTLPLSKAIMWFLSEPVSHFAIVFDEKIIFHSDLMGVRLAWYDTFMKTHEIVHEIKFENASLMDEEQVWQSIVSSFDGKGYDYGAFFFFMWRCTLRKLFKIPFPPRNLWASSNLYLCEEMAGVLPDWVVPIDVKAKDLGMLSPYMLWLELKDRFPGAS